MKRVHFILQGKGGVGKSFVSSLITQFLLDRGDAVMAIDTDPNNATLTSIRAINATFLELFDAENKLNERNFDKLMEIIMTNEDKSFVVDNGATSFLPLINYISENQVFEMLAAKFEVLLHVPITGGQAQEDTIDGFVHLMEKYTNVKFVIWVNEYHGKIQDSDGNSFEGMEVYKKHKKQIMAIVYIREQNEKTFGQDLEEMTKANLTFAEINTDPRFNLMAKQRLKIFKDNVYNQLDVIL